MNIIFMLIACSVFIALVFLCAFFWAVNTGQNDDTFTPSVRILFDDEVVDRQEEQRQREESKSD